MLWNSWIETPPLTSDLLTREVKSTKGLLRRKKCHVLDEKKIIYVASTSWEAT